MAISSTIIARRLRIKTNPKNTPNVKTGKKRLLTVAGLIFLSLVFFLTVFFCLTREGKALFRMSRFILGVFPLVSQETSKISLEEVEAPIKINYSDGKTQTAALLFKTKVNKPQGTVIFSWGIGFTPENVRLLIKTSDVLRGSGVNVFIPLPRDLSEDLITGTSIQSYVNAFEYLEKQPYVDPQKIGFMGFCAGGSLVLVAAQDRKINEEVAFVSSIAPYNNMADYYVQALSRKALKNGVERDWAPHETTRRLLLKNYFSRLPQSGDSQILSDFFVDGRGGNPARLNELSSQGKLALEILQYPSPQKMREIMKLLPENMKNDLKELSPETKIADLKSEVFIIHDKDDPLTPFEESERLSMSLGDRASFSLVTVFDHTILDKKYSIAAFLKELRLVVSQYYRIFYLLS